MTDDDYRPPAPAPVELELADVPRHTRHAPAATATLAPPPLTSAVAPPPRRAGFGLNHALLVAVAVAVVVLAGVLYQRLTRPDVVAVRSPYRSYIGLTMDLPGDGWKRDRRMRKSRTQGPQWMRIEAMFRGRSIDDPDDMVLVFRVFAPGAFAAKVDLDELRRQAQAMSQAMNAVSKLSGGSFDCVADTQWRSEPAARCSGGATLLGRAYQVGISIWQPTTEDLVGIFYISAAVDSSDFESIVRSVQ